MRQLLNLKFVSYKLRPASLAISVTAAMLVSCCAAFIASIGKEPIQIRVGTPRSSIQKEFGLASETHKCSSGGTVDIYLIKGKYMDPEAAEGHLMMDIGTFFIWEIVGTPSELIRAPIDGLIGRKLIIYYKYTDDFVYKYRIDPLNFKFTDCEAIWPSSYQKIR